MSSSLASVSTAAKNIAEARRLARHALVIRDTVRSMRISAAA
jgi:hypothetical protein